MNRRPLLSLSFLGMLFLAMALFAGEVRVTNATATPHWPWDGKVDIGYSLESDVADKTYTVFFTGYDKVLQAEVPATTLSGDGVGENLPVGGPYSTTWDFGADYPKGHYSDIVVKVEAAAEGESFPVVVNGVTQRGTLGETISVTAEEKPGKTFVGWTASGVTLDSYAPQTLSFTMPANEVSLTANYLDTASLYMVVNLLTGETRYSDTAPNLADDTCRTTELWLRKIPAGTFSMGSPEGEVGREDTETQHRVTLTDDYYIGVFEMTQRQYELLTSEKPSYFSNASCYATRPVENVSYDTIRGTDYGAHWPTTRAVDSNSVLGILRNKTGLIFDLPTEAQMEYACRAGTTTSLNSGKNIVNPTTSDDNLNEVARNWFNGGSGYSQTCDTTAGTAKVGSYLPNAWGLYDMHGNVWEWCLDWYGPYSGDAVDPLGAQSGSFRVARGGGCYHYPQVYRSASRGNYFPSYDYYYYGFRVVCIPYQTISVNGEELIKKIGETVSFTAPEKSGKTFTNWTVSGVTVDDTTANPLEFTMPANPVTLFANYDGGPGSETYLVVYLQDDANAGIKAGDSQYTDIEPDLDDDACRTTELWLRRIPAGSFVMGSPETEAGRYANEVQHQVTLTEDYYIGIFEMTQRQYELITGDKPSYFNNADYYATRPVEQISYDMIRGATAGAGWPASSNVDSDSFMGKLRAMTKLVFDLPTEAQWEYACRAGTTTSLNTGKDIVNTGEVADENLNEAGRNQYNGGSQYKQNCAPTAGTAVVGSYLPNAWDLYDMHGNVWEWCLDWNGAYSGDATDPYGPTSGTVRILRGGGWSTKKPELFRSAFRFNNVSTKDSYYLGFRVVCLP